MLFSVSEIRRQLLCHIFDSEWIDTRSGATPHRVSNRNIVQISALYRNAFERGDWFGTALRIRAASDITPQAMSAHLEGDFTLATVFEDSNGIVLGVTALFFDATDGALIDETQIHPTLGRRRGLMTSYFRHVVPFLETRCRYWTEFVLTPQSAVLRRVLLREQGMQVTGLRPYAYHNANANTAGSVLIAHGPRTSVREQLMRVSHAHRLIANLVNACLGFDCTPFDRVQMVCRAYHEIHVSIHDMRSIEDLFALGYAPVALLPWRDAAIFAVWPTYDLYPPFLITEGIPAQTALLKLLKLLKCKETMARNEIHSSAPSAH